MVNIAIDGPAGAGKSTVARLLADKLAYLYIDTGAMYRAFTHKALEAGVNLDDAEALTVLAKNTLLDIKQGNPLRVYLDGAEVTEKIRSPHVTEKVSIVASVAGVREKLVICQRQFAKKYNVVMDGRDIGSHVLPQAQFKFYLTATLEERTNRRYTELLQKGYSPDKEKLKLELAKRDYQDSTRKLSPLLRAADAVLIDTTELNPKQVANRLYNIVTGRS